MGWQVVFEGDATALLHRKHANQLLIGRCLERLSDELSVEVLVVLAQRWSIETEDGDVTWPAAQVEDAACLHKRASSRFQRVQAKGYASRPLRCGACSVGHRLAPVDDGLNLTL